MDERSPAGARRLVARGGILEAFYDGGLSAAIVADYDGHRREELDHCYLLVVEGPDSTDCEFIQVCHCENLAETTVHSVVDGRRDATDLLLGVTPFYKVM